MRIYSSAEPGSSKHFFDRGMPAGSLGILGLMPEVLLNMLPVVPAGGLLPVPWTPT